MLAVPTIAAISLAPNPASGSDARSYVIPEPGVSGVTISPLLTVGDEPIGGYRMVGMPDGLGAFRNADGTISVLMNHELRPDQGAVRAHGRTGSFVSAHVIDPTSRQVLSGRDLITSVRYWDYATGDYSATAGLIPGTTFGFGGALKRFCSGTLVGPATLFNAATGRGYDGRMFFSGEETGDNGRLFATDIATGEARQLPRGGLHSWENAAVIATASDSTALVGTSDSTPGYLTSYVGTKTAAGGPWARAGLTNGSLGALAVTKRAGQTITSDFDFRRLVGTGFAARVEWTDVNWNQRGVAQADQAAAGGALAFTRLEDIAVDPVHARDLYFITTQRPTDASQRAADGRGGLWRLRLDDAAHPEAGGTLTLLLDGNEPGALFNPDNLTVDAEGHILIQEDPGNDAHVAGIFAYRISDGALRRIATFDPALVSAPKTLGEESSGIIDTAGQFGPGTFLFDVQAHHTIGLPPGSGPGTVGELVESGQLSLLTVDWKQVFAPDTHRFVVVNPERILDTRQAGAAPVAGSTTTLTVAGRGGVPVTGAAAVVLNLTATQTSAPGYFSVFAAGSPRPPTSSLNADRTGETVSNQVTVALGAGGAISIFAEQGAQLIVDVAGYYVAASEASAGRLQLSPPTRLLDTRLGPTRPAAGSVTPVALAGQGGVPPSGASAVLLNVTATTTAAAGYITVYPHGIDRPNVSNLNANGVDNNVAALVTVPLGANGGVNVFTEHGAHLIVDVVGWYTGPEAEVSTIGLFVPRPLARMLDSRVGSRLASGSTTEIDLGLPLGTSAVVTNLAVTSSAGPGFVTAFAAGRPQPPTSNINVSARNETLSNAAVVPHTGGLVAFYTDVTTHFIVDVTGYVT